MVKAKNKPAKKAGKVGRKCKRTDELTTRMEKLVYTGVPIRQVLAAVGLSKSVFYRWLQDAGELGDKKEKAQMGVVPLKEFRDRIKKAEGKGVAVLLGRIQDAAEKGTWQAAAWILERRYPNEFGQNRQPEKEGGGALEIEFAYEVIDAEKERKRLNKSEMDADR